HHPRFGDDSNLILIGKKDDPQDGLIPLVLDFNPVRDRGIRGIGVAHGNLAEQARAHVKDTGTGWAIDIGLTNSPEDEHEQHNQSGEALEHVHEQDEARPPCFELTDQTHRCAPGWKLLAYCPGSYSTLPPPTRWM